MNLRPFWIASFWILALLCLPSQAALLIHSNDVLGEIEPCGCRTNPTGGFSRRMNWIAGLKDPEWLQLDAGDLLFQSSQLPELLKDQARVQAQWLLKALDLSGPSVLVPGEKDFALGFKAYRKLITGSRARVVVSNAPTPWQKSYVWKTRTAEGQPLRIAILGVLGTELRWPKELGRLAAPAAALPPLMKSLRGQADLFVVLSHQGLEADQKLAKAVPGIHLIVGAHTQSFLQEPIQVGETWIVQASFRNQQVGAWKIGDKKLRKEDYELRPLDPAYDSPADHPNAVDPLVIQFKAEIAQLNTRQTEALAAQSPANAKGAMHYQTFPRCMECHAKQFEFWRRTPHARALQALVEQKQSKNKECLACHTVGMGPKGWNELAQLGTLKPPSANEAPISMDQAAIEAYLLQLTKAERLEDQIRLLPSDAEAQPIAQTLARIQQLHVPVQCENCHGPGNEHPFAGKIDRRPPETRCLSCHTLERAPGWYKDGKAEPSVILEKIKQMTCPAGEI